MGSRMSPKAENAAPTPAAVAMSPRATRPPETAPTNMVVPAGGLGDGEERAPWRVKCSMVTKLTAVGVGRCQSDPDLVARVAVGHGGAPDSDVFQRCPLATRASPQA